MSRCDQGRKTERGVWCKRCTVRVTSKALQTVTSAARYGRRHLRSRPSFPTDLPTLLQAMWAVGKPVVLPKSVAPFVGLFVQGDSVEVHEIVSTGGNDDANTGAGEV